MLLRVAPDDLSAGASSLSGDGPHLRGLAALIGASRSDTSAAAGGQGRLAAALDGFLDGQQAALATLAETAELLTQGLAFAARQYRETELNAGLQLGGSHD